MAKKEKTPKVKKEKKEKKPGGKKRLLIIPPLLLVVALAVGFTIFRTRGAPQPDTSQAPAGVSEGAGEGSQESAGEGAEGLPENGAPADPPPSPAASPSDQAMTAQETVQYVRSLSPQVLGLEGDSMSSFEIYPSDHVVPVDGVLCTELSIYSNDGSAGNDIEGMYLVSRGADHRLFRLDKSTGAVTELSPAPANAGRTPPPQPSEDQDGGERDG